MANRPDPKDSLARNLRHLMDREHLSEIAMAKRAGVSQKTVNNALNGKHSPKLDSIEKIANAFGLTAWHLILPNLPDELISSPSISRLYNHYASASPEGRAFIDQAAEREASSR